MKFQATVAHHKRGRTNKSVVSILCGNTCFIFTGKEKLNYPLDKIVYVVLEEDGTEVDEEEYFQTLPDNTLLMLLHIGDKWTPFGPTFT